MTKRIPQLWDENWLRDRYTQQCLSTAEIAALIGCSQASICNALDRFGIQSRSRGHEKRSFAERRCEKCEVTYIPTGPSARFCAEHAPANQVRRCATCEAVLSRPGRYCSAGCRFGWGTCRCGRQFARRVRPSESEKMSCSKACDYDARRAAASYRYINDQGYVMVRTPDNPRLRSEQRVVMEQVLGRPLRTDETVHHINGCRADNRPENLQLRSGRHGTGQHFRCADCGSTNLEPHPL